MNYKVYGPFEIRRNGHLVSRRRRDKAEFWAQVENARSGLPDACGCYLLVIRNRAWYVGLAEKQSFKSECFSLHKIVQYNEALKARQGRPSLLLIAKTTPNDRFARTSSRGHKDARLLENLLIGAALRRNPNLQNVHGTRLMREMKVPGVLNTRAGKPSAEVRCLKTALGM